ncbi:MAG: hypothetical protein K2Q18_02440 [Bdellovibrionales bacterium]|nr:hypothetical protein [Bdellovibrionales bacterium]
MSADVRAKILIWTKAGGCCSYLDCPKRLIMSSMEGSRSLVGEVAHIVSEKPRGPRSEYDLRAEGIDFDDDENLMLLCQAHHKIIDEFPEEYSVAFLRERKRVHEARIESLLTPEEKEDAFNKRMVASNISEFEKMIDIDKWRIRTESIVFNGQPYLAKTYLI